MLDASGGGVTIGPSILGLVTSGLYDNPLAVYREYIQNSVDELSRQVGFDGKIKITIDPRQERVSICDNGPGLTYGECLEELVPIAHSKKCLGQDRGFRGIGRLSGLAFAESVTFLTRTGAGDPVTRVIWSKPRLADRTSSIRETEPDFQNWVTVETLDDCDYPERFFRVDLDGISRHSAGVLLNREVVRDYISEVCPVPFPLDFPFLKNVQGIFQPHQAPYSMEITLDGEDEPVRRQYGSAVALGRNKEDYFHEFDEVRVPSIDSEEDAAVGWVAHSSYLGAIPKGSRIRGIRARVGNIQVGGERVFDHLFEEERFNRWCVGELHIVDSRIVPNGRRDYFERNPHLRNLENHLAPIFDHIGVRCRAASSKRNREKNVLSSIREVGAMYSLASSGYLSVKGGVDVVNRALTQATKLREGIRSTNTEKGHVQDLDLVERKLSELRVEDGRFPIQSLSALEVAAYQRVFDAVALTSPSPLLVMNIIEAVFPKVDADVKRHPPTG